LRTAGAFFAEVFAATGLERDRETDFDETLAMVSVAGCSVWNWPALSTRFHAAVQAATAAFHRNIETFQRPSGLSDDAEDADQDQVERNDIIQQSRHDENENACDECNDWRKISDADGHELSPFVSVETAMKMRIAEQLREPGF
jgi:hypothetical protein